MIPVDQTTFGFPGGNCFSACVASLLEIPLAEVPYFMGEEKWFDALRDWLEPRGFDAVCFECSCDWRPRGFHILSGVSPRDPKGEAQHGVVAFGDHVAHDPHPSRAGLKTRADMIVLFRLDPARGRAP